MWPLCRTSMDFFGVHDPNVENLCHEVQHALGRSQTLRRSLHDYNLSMKTETDFFFFFFNQWGHKGFSLARRATQRQMTGKQKAGDKTCWHRRWQSFWQDWRYTTASGRATGLISGAGRLELNRATAVVYTLRERMHDGRMRPFG